MQDIPILLKLSKCPKLLSLLPSDRKFVIPSVPLPLSVCKTIHTHTHLQMTEAMTIPHFTTIKEMLVIYKITSKQSEAINVQS